MKLNPTQAQIEAMVQRLAQQPVLFTRMEALLSARAESLDEAAVVAHGRALGREVLSGWARSTARSHAGAGGSSRWRKKTARPDHLRLDRSLRADLAAAKVREHYGVEVSPERVRQVCLRHAARLAPISASIDRCTGRRRASWPPGGGRDDDALRSDAGRSGRSGSAVARRAVRADGWGVNTRIHAVGDGAPWIPQQAAAHPGREPATCSIYITGAITSRRCGLRSAPS